MSHETVIATGSCIEINCERTAPYRALGLLTLLARRTAMSWSLMYFATRMSASALGIPCAAQIRTFRSGCLTANVSIKFIFCSFLSNSSLGRAKVRLTRVFIYAFSSMYAFRAKSQSGKRPANGLRVLVSVLLALHAMFVQRTRELSLPTQDGAWRPSHRGRAAPSQPMNLWIRHRICRSRYRADAGQWHCRPRAVPLDGSGRTIAGCVFQWSPNHWVDS